MSHSVSMSHACEPELCSVEQTGNLFSPMYDRATVTMHGKYVITKKDVWSSDAVESTCILTENVQTLIPTQWFPGSVSHSNPEETSSDTTYSLFSSATLLRTLLTIRRAMEINRVSWGSILVSLRQTPAGVQVVLLHSNTGAASLRVKPAEFTPPTNKGNQLTGKSEDEIKPPCGGNFTSEDHFTAEWFLNSTGLLLQHTAATDLFVDTGFICSRDDSSTSTQKQAEVGVSKTSGDTDMSSARPFSTVSESFFVDASGNFHCMYPLGFIGTVCEQDVKDCVVSCVSLLGISQAKHVSDGSSRMLKHGSCWCGFTETPTRCVLSLPLSVGTTYVTGKTVVKTVGNVSLYVRTLTTNKNGQNILDDTVQMCDDPHSYIPVVSTDGCVVCVLKASFSCTGNFFLALDAPLLTFYRGNDVGPCLNPETTTNIQAILHDLRISDAILRGNLSVLDVPVSVPARESPPVCGDVGTTDEHDGQILDALAIALADTPADTPASALPLGAIEAPSASLSELVLHPCSEPRVESFELRSTDKIMYCTDARTLYHKLTSHLLTLASAEDVSVWLQSLSHDMNPLVRAVIVRRARDIYQRSITSADLRNRLRDESLSFRECDGFIFDMLFQGGHDVSTNFILPGEWNPTTFYQSGDSGFVSMLYLLQWRSTLQRMIELAVIANIDGTRGILTNLLNTFRVGVMWGSTTGDSPPSVFADIRLIKSTSGESQYAFFFNPSRVSMILKPYNKLNVKDVLSSDWVVTASLQTQCAKNRDSVIAFFIAQAVSLMTKLLFSVIEGDRVENSRNVSSTLIGMYLGSLHDFDLRHTYKHWQRVVRELRQSIPTKKRRGFNCADSRRRQGHEHEHDPIIPTRDNCDRRTLPSSEGRRATSPSPSSFANSNVPSFTREQRGTTATVSTRAQGRVQQVVEAAGPTHADREALTPRDVETGNGRTGVAQSRDSGSNRNNCFNARDPVTPLRKLPSGTRLDYTAAYEYGNDKTGPTGAGTPFERATYGTFEPALPVPVRARRQRAPRNGGRAHTGDARGRPSRPRAPRGSGTSRRRAPRAPRGAGRGESADANTLQLVTNSDLNFDSAMNMTPCYSIDTLMTSFNGFPGFVAPGSDANISYRDTPDTSQLYDPARFTPDNMAVTGNSDAVAPFFRSEEQATHVVPEVAPTSQSLFPASFTDGLNSEHGLTADYINSRSNSGFLYPDLNSLDFGFDSTLLSDDIPLMTTQGEQGPIEDSSQVDFNDKSKDFSFYFATN